MIEDWRSLIGKCSKPAVNFVEKGAVKKFAEAVSDPSPLYVDEEVADKSRHGELIAPPTFPRTFEYGEIQGMGWPESGMIHGEHRVHYERPLKIGEKIVCYMCLKDYYDKESRNGTLGFVVLERIGESVAGERIFTIEDIAIVMPSLRRNLKSERR
jgi:acyl dehydratase